MSHDHHGSYLESKGGFFATVLDWATTVDHKKIGVMYLFAILFMFFLGGVAALAVRVELLEPVRVATTYTADGTPLVQILRGDVPADVKNADGTPAKDTQLTAGTRIQSHPAANTPVTNQLASGTTVDVLDDAGKNVVQTAVIKDKVNVTDPKSGARSTSKVTGQFFAASDATTYAKGNNTYNRLFTLHGAIMVFMVIVPSVPASLGNFFLPLMLGAKDVAFPRLNLLSWYIYVTGSIFAVSSIVLGGVDTGWTFYTPYSTSTDADSIRVVFMILGAFILGFSSILTGLNFIVTVHKLRAPGMGWFDMRLFVWAVYSSGSIQVLATPVIGITLLLLVFERITHIGIFDPALGGDPVLYQHF
ncbi:MAG: cbb3-type cytochrome c oxidase subunit I, partial [Phycisphaerales bacterium]